MKLRENNKGIVLQFTSLQMPADDNCEDEENEEEDEKAAADHLG